MRSSHNSSCSNHEIRPNLQIQMMNTVRTTKTLSHCNCQLETYEDGQFLLCRYVKEWLIQIEARTDQSVVYSQSLRLYERI